MAASDAGSLIGREQDLLELERLIAAHRVVTLVGPGGTGKSRVARELARRAAESLAQCVIVDLAPIRRSQLVPVAIARALGLQDAGSRTLSATLMQYVRNRDCLLVLDNCEHVLDAGPFVTELLLAGSSLHVLATSRVKLQIPDEEIYALAPLEVPNAAAELFVDRALAGGANVSLAPHQRGLIARVVTALKGVPLAIELAAARARPDSLTGGVQDADQRLVELASRLGQLPRNSDVVQMELRLTYDSLHPESQRAFRHLSVCAGGCTRDAAQYICATRAEPTPRLDELLAVGLVRLDAQSDAASRRLTMLEPVRAFALEELRTRGELDEAQARHAAYYVVFAEHAYPFLSGPEQGNWFDRLDRERDNFRVVLLSLRERREAELMAGLVANLAWFWDVRGYLGEGQRWVDDALALAATQPLSDRLHGRCLRVGSQLAWRRGTYEAAQHLARLSYAAAARADDSIGGAEAQQVLANVAMVEGNLGDARTLFETSLELFRAAGDTPRQARYLLNFGLMQLVGGQPEQARATFGEGERLSREVGNIWSLGLTLGSNALCDAIGGDWDAARARIGEGLPLMDQIGFRWGIAHGIVFAGLICAARGDLLRSTRLIGAAGGALEEIGATLWPPMRGLYAAHIELARETLGAHQFDAELATGERMQSTDAIRLALEDLALTGAPLPR
jgi:predicted ATPase